jgi:hypothetical protein
MPGTDVDTKKIEKVISKLHRVINRANLTIPEILITYGNLGYHLGASMAGFKNQGPDTATIEREYRLNPTVDTGLMLQGLEVTSWEGDFRKKPTLSRFPELLEAEEEKKK